MTDLSERPVFEELPYAKINLTLEMIGRRADGFHELKSIFMNVGLRDRLTMRLGDPDGSDSLNVSGLPGAPVEENIVLRALSAVRAHTQVDYPPLEMALEKRIPIAAGLGGGSSDAASAIRLAQEAWGIELARSDVMSIGASLGSDVPFFLSGLAAAVVEGRGEVVSPFPVFPVWTGVLLITPPIAVSTGAVFDAYDRLGLVGSRGWTDKNIGDTWWQKMPEIASWSTTFRRLNDLWPAAAEIAPVLPELHAQLENRTRRIWSLSGSGPTLFATYPSAPEAVEAGRSIVAHRLSSMQGAQIHAVDLISPDAIWRYP